jgi:hypothetical protein
MKVERLCELWRIVEMRNGAVYEMEFVKEVWTTEKVAPEGFLYATLSTNRGRELAESGIPTMRIVR